MPSAGSAFRRGGSGAGRATDAPIDRRWRKVEAFAITAATMICALAIGLTVVTLYQLTDESQSAADARQPATVVLAPASGPAGSTVAVRGANFPRDASVVFTWDGGPSNVPTIRANRRGAFEATMIVPLDATAGRHVLSASATGASGRTGTNSSAEATFELTITVPPTATPIPTPAPTLTPTPRPTPTGTTPSTPTPAPTPTPVPTAPPPPSGSLSPVSVRGNALVNAAGQPVQLLGVNRSGTEYACIQGWGIFDGPNDAASVRAIAAWRTNAVRVPLNEDCWLAINGAPAAYSGSAYRQAITSYVNLLNQNGLYAILELHWTAPGTQKATGQQPTLDRDHSVTFWSQVAATFKGNDAVLLEPHNEPYPDNNRDTVAAWQCWRDGGTCPGQTFQAAGMQEVVTAIRATGATNVILLSGVQYANALSRWLTYAPTDPLNNLAASWHVYNFNVCAAVTCWNTTVAPLAAQVPVVATEIGTDNCSASFMNSLMDWLDARNSGYLAWTWDDWGTACADIALIVDYTGTPTTYGQVYKAHLAAR